MYKDIFDAATANNFTAVQRFIEVDGIRPDEQNFQEDTVAHIAAYNDNMSMLQYLLKKDPSLLTARGQAQSTLLEIAIAINSLTLVKYLVEECEVDVLQVHCDQPPPDTYVHFAAEMGNLEVFKYFVEERKIDVSLKNEWRQPPAFAAARESHLNIIKYIVEEHKGDVTTTDTMHRNILCQSAVKSDLTIPRYLLDEKKLPINVNNAFIIQDAISSTELLKCNKLDEFLKYFIEEKRMYINAGTEAIPLHRAASAGMLDVVKYLVRHGADVRRKDFMGRTPVEVATDNEVIKYLQEFGPKRTRRSLSKSVIPHPDLMRRSSQTIWRRMIRGSETSLTAHPVGAGDILDSFLVLLKAFVCTKVESGVQQVSWSDFIGTRMDSVAIDAVCNYSAHNE